MTKPKKGIANLRLKHERESHNWSQEDVAELIGTSAVNVSRWERGITFPNPYFRHKLCTLFEKSAQALGLSQDLPDPGAPDPIYDPALPFPFTRQQTLIGREHELTVLKQRLCQDEYQGPLAFHGLPGVGKTSLAIAVAHDDQIQAHFPDGILWAGLGPKPHLPGHLSRWGQLLGVTEAETSGDNWQLALRTAIRMRRMLLIIDDAWDLEHVLELQVGGPRCAYLVTTRFPQLAVGCAEVAPLLIQELNEADSSTLLRKLAPDVFVREPEALASLVALVGHLPLGLTLMGKYLRTQGYSGQPRRIRQALERLHDLENRLALAEPQRLPEASPSMPRGVPVSLQTVIAVSEQRLSEQARAALRALASFPAKPNSFSEEAALAVAQVSAPALDELIDSGLLERRDANRYTLHQTIADYAEVSLEDATTLVRMIEYFVGYAEAHATDHAALEQEANNILTALNMAVTLDMQAEFVRGVSAWRSFLESRGWYELGEKLLKQAKEVTQALHDHASLIDILLSLGNIEEKRGQYAQAERYLQEGLSLAEQMGNREKVCSFLRDLGFIMRRRGDYRRAEKYLQEGLEQAHSMRQLELECSLLTTLGGMVGERGLYKQAEAYLQEGLRLACQLGNHERMCFLLATRGAVAHKVGEFAQAEEYLQEGLRLARQLGHRERISTFLTNLGTAAMEQKDFARAEEYLQEGLTLTRALGHPEGICLLLANLGIVARQKEEYLRAAEYLRECLFLAQEIECSWIICIALIEQGELYLKQQQLKEAASSFCQALELVPQENREMIAIIQYDQARVAAAQGDLLEARRLGQESLSIFEEMEHVQTADVRAWLEGAGFRN